MLSPTSFKAFLGFTPFHLVYGQEALFPIEVKLSSLKVLPRSEKNGKDLLKICILDLERLSLCRDYAMEHYAKKVEERKKKFNADMPPKNIIEGSLALRYNNWFDYNKGDTFAPH